MKRIATFCAGLLLMGSMTGCCLLGYGGGYGGGNCGYGAAYPSGGGCGSCGAYPQAYAPNGATAFAPAGQMAFAPGPPTVAMQPLSTY